MRDRISHAVPTLTSKERKAKYSQGYARTKKYTYTVFLLNYQGSGTKLMDARDLSPKRSVAIAFALLDIFTTLGPPAILGCDNGREFSTAAGSKSEQITEKEVRICFRKALHRSHTRD